MLSLTSEYALRAVIYLAQNEQDWPIPGRQIAAKSDIPAKYLLKILGDLVRIGVLDSSPGKNGGFRMRHDAKRTKLFSVLAPFEHFEHRSCPFGNAECSERSPCLAHDRWKRVVEEEQRFLQEMSVFDIAVGTKGRGGRGSAKRVGARKPKKRIISR